MKKLLLFFGILFLSTIALASCFRKADETYAIRKAARDTEVVYQIGDFSEQVSRDLILPSKSLGVKISWESSNKEVLTNQGVVNYPAKDTNVVLTAKLNDEESKSSKSKTFNLVILSKEKASAKIKSLVEVNVKFYITSDFREEFLNKSVKLISQIPTETDKQAAQAELDKVILLKNATEKEKILLDLINKTNYEEFKKDAEQLGTFFNFNKKLFNEKELLAYNKIVEYEQNSDVAKIEELNTLIEDIKTSLYYNSFKNAYKNIKLASDAISKTDLTLSELEKVAKLEYNYLDETKQQELKTSLENNAQTLFAANEAEYKELLASLIKVNNYKKQNAYLVELLASKLTDEKEKQTALLALYTLSYTHQHLTLDELKAKSITNAEVKALFDNFIKKAEQAELLKEKVKQIIQLSFEKEGFGQADIASFKQLFTELKQIYENQDLNQAKLFDQDSINKNDIIAEKLYKDLESYVLLEEKLSDIENHININKLAETAKPENVANVEKLVLAELKNNKDNAYNEYLGIYKEETDKISKNNTKISELAKEKSRLISELKDKERQISKSSKQDEKNKLEEEKGQIISKLDQINVDTDKAVEENKRSRDRIANAEKEYDIESDKLQDYVLILAIRLIADYNEKLIEINKLLPTQKSNLLNYYNEAITNKYMGIAKNLLNQYSSNEALNTYVGKAEVNKVVDGLLNFSKINSFDKEVVIQKNKDLNYSIRKVQIAKAILTSIFIVLGLLIFFVLQSISCEYAEKRGYEEIQYKLLASIPFIGILILSRMEPRRVVRKGILYRAAKPTELLAKSIIYLELILLSIIVLVPIIYMIGLSLQKTASTIPNEIWPRHPSFDTYKSLFTETEFPKWYGNTLLIALVNMVFGTVIITGASYVFARFNFKGKKAGLLTLLALQSFPTFMGLIAMYVLFQFFGLTGKPLALSILYIGGSIPGNIWLIKGFMDNIPKDLDESAAIDGANKLTIFFRIIFPLSVPILTFVALGMFMAPWMDFMLPSYLLNELPRNAAAGARVEDQWTVAVGLFKFVNDPQRLNYAAFAAGALVVGIPITILYTAFQRYLIEGIMAGATKG